MSNPVSSFAGGSLWLLRASVAVLVFSSLMFSPARADQPHYYMLLEEGNERSYCRTYDGALIFHTLITQVSGGVSFMEETRYMSDPPQVLTRYFHMADNGDVWELPEPGSDQADWVLILDMPLTPGKSWGRTWGEFDQYYARYTVWSPETVYTIFGQLTAVPVRYEYFNGDYEEGITWYADGYGKVEFVYSCAFCHWALCDAVIGVDEVSWGSLKALYR